MRIAAVALGSVLAAAVAAAYPKIKHPDPPLYRLKIDAPEIEELHDKYLSIKNDRVVLDGDAPVDKAMLVFIEQGDARGLVELHRWPVRAEDHALGLFGSNGKFDLLDITDPPNVPDADWRGFTAGKDIDGRSQPHLAEGPISWRTLGSDMWAAWPAAEEGVWNLNWWDGSGISIQVYQRVNIAYERIDTAWREFKPPMHV